ncbi:DUF805 domain-containing protein [Streptomyces sp. NPDC001812]|uniref:DUF805 domain-containing protein n=1 Tax=Streptomyces cathayae TaxID=3031124 RepID=A0ABY8K2Y1_9ACTN|nr:DUF805 domain-containing protein [Streptomyces sp. HUAS 5]WGD42451.1 DUF805 domain-containing protein [Streptomyces sp. HUAS 5]
MNWYIEVLKKYAVFNGRARRKEYWMFTLFSVIVSIVLTAVDAAIGIQVLQPIYAIAVLLPTLAVTVRRLHDTNRSGWWIFIALIPLVGFIVMLVFLATEGTPGENKYGANPKEPLAKF